jgi:hypothetical protein
MDKTRPYAFDFDGVIAKYDGFKGVDHLGEPNEAVVAAIRKLSALGNKIIIYSTRGEEQLKEYCELHNIPVDYYNRNPEKEGVNIHKPIAYVYVDDRAVCYRGQSTDELVDEILNFKAYWQK